MSILMYHSVESGWNSPLAVDPHDFERHCEWLAARRRVIDLGEAARLLDSRGRLPAGVSALTFDDGFPSVHQHAFPLLLRHRLPATVFLVAGTLEPGSTEFGDGRSWLTLDQVLEMQDAGIRFGSHSLAHRILTSLDPDVCEDDLRRSRESLEDRLGRPVPFLAYPGGFHNEMVRAAAARAGFTRAFGTSRGREPAGPFAIPRIGVYPGDGIVALRLKTARWYVTVRRSGVFPALRRLARRPTSPTTAEDDAS